MAQALTVAETEGNLARFTLKRTGQKVPVFATLCAVLGIVLGLGIGVWVVAVYVGLTLVQLARSPLEEEVVVAKDFGVQLNTTYWFGRKKQQFIACERIDQVVINEGITFFSVVYYLAFILHDQDDLVLAFQDPPRLPLLRQVYAGTRKMLFGEETQTTLFTPASK